MRLRSTVLANIYLRYVLDLWFHAVVKPRCKVRSHGEEAPQGGAEGSPPPANPGFVRLEQLLENGARHNTARQRDIYKFLGELTRDTGEPEIAIVTVATHGVSDQGGDFLVASDSLRERTLLTGVAIDELLDEIARVGAGRRLVLLDACRERLGQDTRTMAESAMAAKSAR